MKKLYSITVATGLALALTGCGGPSAPKSSTKMDTTSSLMKLDTKKVCDVKANGIKNVIATAKKYNMIASKHGVEFRRLGVNNSSLIASVEAAIKSGAKTVQPITIKKKKFKPALETNYAAVRACKFAVRALQQEEEGKSTWRLAVPGDGFKY